MEYLTGPILIYQKTDEGFCTLLKELTTYKSIIELFSASENQAIKNGFYHFPVLSQYARSQNLEIDTVLADELQYAEENLTVHSLLGVATQNALFGAIYRILDLTSLSIQHRISRSKLPTAAKFTCCTIVSTLPYFIMAYFGYPSSELIIATSVRIAISFLCSTPSLQNSVREIDLPSRFKNFYVINFIYQNLAYTARNLISTILIVDTFIPIISGIQINQCTAKTATTAKIELGISGNDIILHAPYTCTGPVKYFTDEIGWMLGKMAVDSVAILLKKVGIVKDLRDPFAPLFSCFSSAQKEVSKFGQRLKVIQSNYMKQHADMKPKQKPKRIRTGTESSNDSAQEEWQYCQAYRSFKLKKAKKVPQQQSPVENKAVEKSQVIVDTRETIEIPGTCMILVPLVSEHTNLWGIVSTRESTDTYNEALQRPGLGVSGDGPLKFIRKTSTGHNYYELKPQGRSDFRAVGMNHFDDEVEDVLYNAMNRYTSYEDAMPIAASLFQQINSNDKRIELINFDRIENHKEARKAFMSV